MADIIGNLWEHNLARVVFVDVSDDYRLMQPPLPSEYYPILKETWLPRHRLSQKLSHDEQVQGFLYDWHEVPTNEGGSWYVGVVAQDLAQALQAL